MALQSVVRRHRIWLLSSLYETSIIDWIEISIIKQLVVELWWLNVKWKIHDEKVMIDLRSKLSHVKGEKKNAKKCITVHTYHTVIWIEE